MAANIQQTISHSFTKAHTAIYNKFVHLPEGLPAYALSCVPWIGGLFITCKTMYLDNLLYHPEQPLPPNFKPIERVTFAHRAMRCQHLSMIATYTFLFYKAVMTGTFIFSPFLVLIAILSARVFYKSIKENTQWAKEHQVRWTFVCANEGQPLHAVVLYGDPRGIAKKLESGADVNERRVLGKTPIHFARNLKTLQLLVEKGADVTAKDDQGKTILHHQRSFYNHLSILTGTEIDYLVQRGININEKDNQGRTPLHAEKTNQSAFQAKFSEALLNRGANPNAKDNQGVTAIQTIYLAHQRLLILNEINLLSMWAPNLFERLTTMDNRHRNFPAG